MSQANDWRTVKTGDLPEPVASESVVTSVPTPPNLGYYPESASRGAVQVPDISTVDNLRQYYREGGSYRRFWPKQGSLS
jgi:hypothetical protein